MLKEFMLLIKDQKWLLNMLFEKAPKKKKRGRKKKGDKNEDKKYNKTTIICSDSARNYTINL